MTDNTDRYDSCIVIGTGIILFTVHFRLKKERSNDQLYSPLRRRKKYMSAKDISSFLGGVFSPDNFYTSWILTLESVTKPQNRVHPKRSKETTMPTFETVSVQGRCCETFPWAEQADALTLVNEELLRSDDRSSLYARNGSSGLASGAGRSSVSSRQ